jgi:glycerophosphoryl diester phosphodiesterase
MPALSLLTLAVAAAAAAGTPAPRPRLVAVQGLRYHAPESTLSAFAAALELRVGVSAPIRRTRDGKLVIVHDEELARTTSGRGPVAALPLGDVRKLDAGTWFDREFAGEKVPTVEELLALAKQRRGDALLLLELEAEGAEPELARLVARSGLGDRVVIAGRPAHDPALRRKVRAAVPHVGLAVLAQAPDELEPAVTAPDADWVLTGYLPSVADAARIHKAGRRLLVAPRPAGYDPDLCARAAEAQADALLTDFPLECRALWRSAERATSPR